MSERGSNQSVVSTLHEKDSQKKGKKWGVVLKNMKSSPHSVTLKHGHRKNTSACLRDY
jgi:hypothetical protein